MANATERNNCRNSRCSMQDDEIDTIVSAIHLMLERSHHVGVDLAEIVKHFLNNSLIEPERNQFWTELKAGFSERWPKTRTVGAS
jgi:hypothetical protein